MNKYIWIPLSLLVLSLGAYFGPPLYQNSSDEPDPSSTEEVKDDKRDNSPLFVYLTWSRENTSNHMVVNYLTRRSTDKSWVYYDTVSRSGKAGAYRHKVEGTSRAIKGVPRHPHSVVIDGLKPGQTYYFIAGHPQEGFSQERKFRTLPYKKGAVRLVTGGDMGTSSAVGHLVKLAGKTSPHVALVGGDIAYANGILSAYKKWDTWLKYWDRHMVTKDGFTVPSILAIGNHEVVGGFRRTADAAPFFFNYFHQGRPVRSYFCRRLGPHAVVFVLDSSHVASPAGDQKKWLIKKLKQYRNIPYKFAVYHVPLYPSHRSYYGLFSLIGRTYWGPVFDKYNMTVCFENHDHTYKRSKLLKDGKAVKKGGTLYLGDGCWGRTPRSAKKRWYLKKSLSKRNFIQVDIGKKKLAIQAFGMKGKVLDRYELKK